MKDNLCQVHSTLTDVERRLSHICLFKACPSVFSFCCNTCRNQRHQAHSGRVISLVDFHKNLNALKVELNRRLRMEAKDFEAQKILQKLKVIKNFRYQISLVEANLLECVMDLGKLHSDHVSQQSRVLSQLEQTSLSSQSGEAAQLSVKGLSGLVEYNPTKMKLEVVVRARKNRTRQDVAKRVGDNSTCLRQYLVKIIDVLLETSTSEDKTYTVQEFKTHLQSQVSHLQYDIQHNGITLRSLRTRLSNIEEHLGQPFDFEEWAGEPQKIQERVRVENELQTQQIARQISQIQDRRSTNSMTNLTDLVLDDDRSVACSIDFSRMESEALPVFRERMVSMKIKIKKLESENSELLSVKNDLQHQLTKSNSKLADLIHQIRCESQASAVFLPVTIPVAIGKKKLRLRSLQGITVFPEINKYKQQFQQVLELYNQVVQQHYDVKDKMFSAETSKEGLLEEGRRLKKKLGQQDRQIGSLRRDILQKSQQIQFAMGELSALQAKLQSSSSQTAAVVQLQEERLRLQHQLVHNRQQLVQFQNRAKSQQSQRNVDLAKIAQYQVRVGVLQGQIETRSEACRQEFQALTNASLLSQEALDKTLIEHRGCGDILQLQKQEVAQLKVCLGQSQQLGRKLQQMAKTSNQEKEELFTHNQTIKSIYLAQTQKIKCLQQELVLRVQDAQKCMLQKDQQADWLKKQVERLRGQVKQTAAKSVQEFKSNNRQVESLLSKLETAKAAVEKSQRECSHLSFELSNLKVHLQQREEARIQCDKDMQIWRSVFSEQLRKVKEESAKKLKQSEAQNAGLEQNLKQALLQISPLKQDDIDKKAAITELGYKFQVKKRKPDQRELISGKMKAQSLRGQNSCSHLESSQDRTRNEKMASYINQLENKIAEIQQRVDPKLVKSKQREIESILGTLRSDISTLQQKLRDKEMIQKIYMKEFQAKKQDIIRLKSENEVLKNVPLSREDRRVFVLDKENKKTRKPYMSFDQI